jgi:hypothetical protein
MVAIRKDFAGSQAAMNEFSFPNASLPQANQMFAGSAKKEFGKHWFQTMRSSIRI